MKYEGTLREQHNHSARLILALYMHNTRTVTLAQLAEFMNVNHYTCVFDPITCLQ